MKPVSTGKRVSPQDRDLYWFARLCEHGPLPSSFLLAYSKLTHASEKRAKERLTDLFNEDNTADGGVYLERPPQQFRTLDARYNQLVYDLAPAALKALGRSGDEIMGRQAHPGPWLHGHMVACITASIELAARARQDVSFISGAQILARAGAELRHATTIKEPGGAHYQKDLLPDALFGLEYHTAEGSRFRFFVVEADRGTEPATSKNFNRKSGLRNLLQYQDYVESGGYRDHLGLTAPLLVLNVTAEQKRTDQMVRLTDKYYPDGNSYQLFQSWDAFGPVYRPPEPNPALLSERWSRAGLVGLAIDRV